MSRRTRLALTAATAVLVAAAPASAATRHVAPGGTGAAPCTDAAAPCPPAAGLASAQAGDTVMFAGGLYGLGMSGVAPPVPLTVTARPGEAVILRHAGGGPAWTVSGPGNVIDGVTIANTGAGPALAATPGAGVTVRRATLDGAHCAELETAATAVVEDSALTGRAGSTCLHMGPSGVLRRSTVTVTGLSRGTPPAAVATGGVVEDSTVRGGIAMHGTRAVVRRSTSVGGLTPAIAGNGTVVNSVAVNLAPDGEAVAADGMSFPGAAPALRLVGVTALAPNGVAVHARSGCVVGRPAVDSVLSMVNTVARGRTDIRAEFGVSCVSPENGHTSRITTSFSAWTTREPVATSLGAGVIDVGPGNVSGDPRLTAPAGTDPLALDLRPLPGSPLVDAGVVADEASPSDRDGRPRMSGAAPDIGAHELQQPPPSPPAPGGPPPPVRDATAPSVTAGLLRSVVRAGRAAIVAARLGEAATMRVAVARLVPGRRRAGACVAPAAAPAGAARCTRAVRVRPVVTVRVGAGTVRIPLGGRRLAPGTYRVTVSAVDRAGNAAAPVRMTLRVVR